MPASRAKLLILGGTGEALQLAEAVAARFPGLPVVSSLAGRTRDPTLPAGGVRVGGFGGGEGLARYLIENHVSLLINATHPYAAEISRNALEARDVTYVSLLRLLRPAWREGAGDTWIHAGSAREAAAICGTTGRSVFLSLGIKDVADFANLSECRFTVRSVDAPQESLPLARYETMVARGPFSLVDERRLLTERNIDLIVTKNSGGTATYAKIVAARELNIPVVMIDRPKIACDPGCETVDDVEAAMAWIAVRRGI